MWWELKAYARPLPSERIPQNHVTVIWDMIVHVKVH